MIEALIEGVLTGCTLSWTFGAVFFALIQTSLEHGWKKGMHIAAGVAISDIIFLVVAVAGTSLIPGINDYNTEIGVGGGILLVIFGLSMFFKKHRAVVLPKTRWGSFMYFLSTGFFLNFLNPLNFFAWITLSTIISASSFTAGESAVYYVSVITGIFVNETLIAFSAHTLKKFFTERIMKLVDILSGIVFISIGAYLITKYTIGIEVIKDKIFG